MTATYTNAIGTTADGGQVHLAMRTASGLAILCHFGRSTQSLTHVIAPLPEEGGRAETLDALLTHEVRLSRLCRNCFAPRIRSDYRNLTRAEIEKVED